jgi:hypothetical protein
MQRWAALPCHRCCTDIGRCTFSGQLLHMHAAGRGAQRKQRTDVRRKQGTEVQRKRGTEVQRHEDSRNTAQQRSSRIQDTMDVKGTQVAVPTTAWRPRSDEQQRPCKQVADETGRECLDATEGQTISGETSAALGGCWMPRDEWRRQTQEQLVRQWVWAVRRVAGMSAKAEARNCSLRGPRWDLSKRRTFCLRRLQLSHAWAVRCRCSRRGMLDGGGPRMSGELARRHFGPSHAGPFARGSARWPSQARGARRARRMDRVGAYPPWRRCRMRAAGEAGQARRAASAARRGDGGLIASSCARQQARRTANDVIANVPRRRRRLVGGPRVCIRDALRPCMPPSRSSR